MDISQIDPASTRRFLNPGEFYFCGPDCQIHTLLGSCIAITLWHPILHVGGMCHFVLAGSALRNKHLREAHKLNGRYSNDVMKLFEIEAQKRGTSLPEYQAKIFGGSNMLPCSRLQESQQIGKRNTEAALQHLSECGITLLASHVGDTGHRRIAFDVASGDVWVKHEPL